jgi:DNA mismatch repair protein MutS2
MVRLIAVGDSMPFEGLSDIRSKLHKSAIENAVLSPTELLSVCDGIRVSRLLKNYFRHEADKFPHLSDLATGLHEDRMLEKHITDAIDETGEVRDTASKDLARIRRQIFEKSSHLRSRLQKILKRVAEDDMIMEDFATIREERFVIPVKAEHKRHIPGIIHGVSQTGATVFLEPTEIFEMNNEISLLKNEEKREIYKILTGLTSEIGVVSSEFLRSIKIIAHFDSILARGRYALDCGGIKPILSDDNEIELRNIKHPLLIQSKGLNRVIPLSIEFLPVKRGHLISGPNAGGKTVALKSIGINIAMALSGIFPLGECRTNYRTIFTSIGDHQSIQNDLSTFSSQITQIQKILSDCTSQSLVLIDEIGSGTDPQEGSALAAGILDTFVELNLFFIATTHQSSLKSYALSRHEIENASLEFDQKVLKPTYKFMEGIPGNSYAFILAESLGLSKLVLQRARQYLGTRQAELEESISALQKYKFEAEQLRMEAESEKIKAETARKKYEEKLSEIKEKRAKIMSDARSDASEILQNANALIENTIKDIRESKKPVAEIKKEYKEVRQSIEKQISTKSETEGSPKEEEISFEIGDSVLLEDSTSVGTILAVDEKSQMAVVDFNGLKFRIAFAQITKTEAKDKLGSGYSEYISYSAQVKLDLRGKRAEESIREVDDFISEALMGNVQMITIIHGKGTGALRVAIHEFLKTHPSVVSFRLGNLIEGGAGVTIVEL